MHNGNVDLSELTALLDWHIESGTDGVVVLGTTGESVTLTSTEREEILQVTVAHVDGRMAVIAGTGSNATAKAVAYTEEAKQAGVDGCLLVTPYYNKPDQAGLMAHFSHIADLVDIPQILYNVPGRTGCDLLNETVIALAEHPNIVGLKDATGDLSRLEAVKDLVDFALLSGDDGTTLAYMQQGGHGAISVTANIMPAHMAAMIQAVWEGDAKRAQAIDAALQPLHQALFVAPNPVPVKWLLAHMAKISSGELRLPLVPLAEDQHQPLVQALAHAQIYQL